MEESIFPLPAVAGIMNENFIEARLHADGDVNIERIKELQMTLAQSVATPIYLIVDPKTGMKKATLEGATLGDESRFVAFLEEGLKN